MTTTTTAKGSFFVQVPLTVIERKGMHAAYKIGFEQFLYVCWKQHSDTLQGSSRKLAALCSVTKSSFTSMAKAWLKAGWITLETCGRELLITLLRDGMLRSAPAQSVQNSDTTEQDQPSEVPPTSVQNSDTPFISQDIGVPNSDNAVLPVDTFVQNSDANDQNSDANCPSAELKVEHKRERENLLESPIDSPKRETSLSSLSFSEKEDKIPELTPELVLDLVGRVLTVPPRPTTGIALERWYTDWHQPAQQLIADLAPLTGPLAWAEIDLVVRFMVFGPSWWATKRQKTTAITMKHVQKNYLIQCEQLAKTGWESDKRTAYPGVPSQESVEDAQQVDQAELDTLVAALLAPEVQNSDAQELPQAPRIARPFASRQELLDYADTILQCVPELQLVIVSGAVLLAQCGPDDSYIGIDPEIWEYPTAEELELIHQAVSYGRSSCTQELQAVTI